MEQTNKESKKRTITGEVVSNKMHQTITVKMMRKVKHPIYGKYVLKSTKVHAHDANNQCQIGDNVTIAESRPISKTKHWVLRSINGNVQN